MSHLAVAVCRHIAVAALPRCSFYQAQFPDITRYRCLRYIKTGTAQMFEKILLPVNRIFFNQVKIA